MSKVLIVTILIIVILFFKWLRRILDGKFKTIKMKDLVKANENQGGEQKKFKEDLEIPDEDLIKVTFEEMKRIDAVFNSIEMIQEAISSTTQVKKENLLFQIEGKKFTLQCSNHQIIAIQHMASQGGYSIHGARSRMVSNPLSFISVLAKYWGLHKKESEESVPNGKSAYILIVVQSQPIQSTDNPIPAPDSDQGNEPEEKISLRVKAIGEVQVLSKRVDWIFEGSETSKNFTKNIFPRSVELKRISQQARNVLADNMGVKKRLLEIYGIKNIYGSEIQAMMQPLLDQVTLFLDSKPSPYRSLEYGHEFLSYDALKFQISQINPIPFVNEGMYIKLRDSSTNGSKLIVKIRVS